MWRASVTVKSRSVLWLCGDSSRNITIRLSLSAASSDESLAILVVGTAETAKDCAFYSRNNAGRFEKARRCLSFSRASVLKSFISICKKKEIVLSGRNKLSILEIVTVTVGPLYWVGCRVNSRLSTHGQVQLLLMFANQRHYLKVSPRPLPDIGT